MKGIDKRTHKNRTVSCRARVRIKGHPVLIQSFASKTLAMKWKRDTESAVEQGKYAYDKTGSKNTLAELIDRYIERVLPSKPKNARNVRQHLFWWKQELEHCLLSDIKPSLISQKREELLSGLTYKGKLRSATTLRALGSISSSRSLIVVSLGVLLTPYRVFRLCLIVASSWDSSNCKREGNFNPKTANPDIKQ